METPRQRWWNAAMQALRNAQNYNEPDAYRAAQAGIANAYLQMVHLTYVHEDPMIHPAGWDIPKNDPVWTDGNEA